MKKNYQKKSLKGPLLIIILFLSLSVAISTYYNIPPEYPGECRDQYIFNTNLGSVKGPRTTFVAPCDGEIQSYAYDDNFIVGLTKVENNDKNLLIGCDNEVYGYHSDEFNFCYDSVPQHGAIMCDRDGDQIARLSAGHGLGCPGGKIDNYKIQVKKGDVLEIANSDWSKGKSWVYFYAGEVITECNDNIDNDNDGEKDEYDSGCWDDPSDPHSYNEELDDESSSDILCHTNMECGMDLFLGKVCQGPKVFEKISQKTCNNPGTGISSCSANTVFDFIKTCAYGCIGGTCNSNPNACTTDSDCSHKNYNSDNYCKYDDIYYDFHKFKCGYDQECFEKVIKKFVKSCEYGCSNGACKPEPHKTECEDNIDNDNDGVIDEDDPGCWDNPNNPNTYNSSLDDESRNNPVCTDDADCPNDFYSDAFCKYDDVYKTFHDYSCGNDYTCTEQTTNTKVEDCPFGCSNGACKDDPNNNDTTNPIVDLINPQNGSTVSGIIDFDYTVNDSEGQISECRLILNNNVLQTTTNILPNVNTFTQSFTGSNVYYTVAVGCFDDSGNYGEDDVTFFYTGNNSVCSANADCGEVSTGYTCNGDDLMRQRTKPVCSSNSCSVTIEEEFVRTCIDGCLNDHCRSDRQDDDDDRDPIIIRQSNRPYPQIIQDNNQSVLFDKVIYANAPVELNTEDASVRGINYISLLTILLIIGILILIALIIIYMII